ncbi:MAG: BamA/TamA family outer membrane protein [Deltaproteobacteria bacterium]|nr:BamA/TamA family outer membrane protein [Deltaproteobacteria bacterium]
MNQADLCRHDRPRRRRPGRRLGRAISLCLALLLLPAPCLASSFFDGFKDPTDGQFDTSDWLLSKRGFLPVPIIITEPAIGYGGGLALLFFHKSKHDKEKEESDELLGMPPSVSAVFGAGTENGTWMAGGGHFGSWKEDRIRYTGGAGYASMNLTFYAADVPIDFNIEGALVSAKFEFRIPDTDLFLGVSYDFTNIDATRKPGPDFLPDTFDDSIGGLGLSAHWDSRDTIFTTSKGQDLTLSAVFNAPAFGGSTMWQNLGWTLHSYHPVHERVVVSLRLDGNSTWGEVPFYARPFVELRGIPALRYQGDAAGEGEIDLRVRVWKRWSLVGFFGAGWTTNSLSGDNGPFPAGGGGFRYLLARKLGMQVGVDVARGPEDTAFYIQVGSAW